MKGFRSTLVMATLVLAVGGFAYWEYKKSQTEEIESATQGHLFKEVQADEVTELSYQSGTVEYTLKKENGRWLTASPIADDGDEDSITAQIRNLLTQEAEAVESESIDWAKYGLAQPMGTFSIKVPGGESRIEVGTVRSYDQGYYLRKNSENKLYVVGSALESYLNKTSHDFRSKMLKFVTGDIVTLKYTSKDAKKSGQHEFVKKEGVWQHAQKQSIKIDSSAINALIANIRELKADAIVAEDQSVSNLKLHGLASPILQIELGVSDKSTTVQFGKNKNEEYFVVSSENKPIYKTSISKTNELIKSLDDLRDKVYPFKYDPAQVQAVKIKNTNLKNILSLKKSGETWVDEASAQSQVKQDEVSSLIKGLADLTVEEFASGPKASLGSYFELLDAAGKTVFSLSFGAARKSRNEIESYVVKTNLADENILVAKSSIDKMVNKTFVEPEKKAP